MASAIAPPLPPMAPPAPRIENLAELLERLGNVPPWRVRYHPLGSATEADLLALLEAPGKRVCELIDGVLVEKPMGYRESVIAVFVAEKLNGHVRPRNLGLVSGADGALRLWTGRVRIPDVAFVSWDRLPGRRRPTEPIPDFAPDLAVEVLSESNTPQEMALKRQEYFGAGTQLVWEIDPDARTARVYTAPDTFTDLTAAGALDGGAVLPGFMLPLAELDRQG